MVLLIYLRLDREMPEIISRSDAVKAGLRFYFTGKPCKHGHISERHIASYNCAECESLRPAPKYNAEANKIRKKRFREKRRKLLEPIRAAQKAERDATRSERRKASALKWYYKNIEYSRETYEKNKEQIKARRRARSSENLEIRRAENQRRRARKRNAEGHFTAKDVTMILAAQGGACPGCMSSIALSYHVDHIVPLSRGGSNWPSNIQLLCEPCNLRKGARTMDEWRASKAEAA